MATTPKEFDLVVIGAGPGGYVAAIRAAQLGFRVAIVEKDKTLGGTCLNRGCIPSKALLESSYLYKRNKEEGELHGLKFSSLGIDLGKMIKRKEGVVKKLTTGIDFLMKKNKIERILGVGTLKSNTEVEVSTKGNGSSPTLLKTKNILLATGSVPSSPPSIKVDGKDVVTSTEALCFKEVPKKLVVVGGGYIGLEMGLVWSRLGSDVTVVEFMDRLLPNMDKDLGNGMKTILSKQGLKFMFKTKVENIQVGKGKTAPCKVSVTGPSGSEDLKADKVLVSVGRRPFHEGLGLEVAGVKINDRGFVEVNDQFQTNVPNVYAIGDLIGGIMLAHKAEEEGVAVAEIMHGESPEVNYPLIPSILYTHPEVASVGMTEEQLKEKNIPYVKGSFPFKANGRALSVADDEGFVKILSHKDTDEILGAHLIGPNCSEMIHEFCVAMEFNATSEDLAMTMHGHPTFSEGIKEAALSVHKRGIHS